MIETVLGPIPAGALGATSMHEHVLSDARALLATPPPAAGEFDAELAARDPMALPANLVLDDVAVAAAGLSRAHARGITSVVDPTVWGFGGPAPGLLEVSRRSNVHIVAGVGAYVPRTRPDWLRALGADELTALFLAALRDGLPGCTFRAGIVGMIAPGHPLQAEDERLLEAAAASAGVAGASVIVRLDPRFRDGADMVARLCAAGVGADRIVLSNIDGYAADPDRAALDELAATGAVLKWCFGYEAPPRPGLRAATDADRVEAVCELWAAGARRQVLACGIWTRHALHAHGGWGYEHLGASVLPALRARGLEQAAIDTLHVDEPRRLLDV